MKQHLIENLIYRIKKKVYKSVIQSLTISLFRLQKIDNDDKLKKVYKC